MMRAVLIIYWKNIFIYGIKNLWYFYKRNFEVFKLFWADYAGSVPLKIYNEYFSKFNLGSYLCYIRVTCWNMIHISIQYRH